MMWCYWLQHSNELKSEECSPLKNLWIRKGSINIFLLLNLEATISSNCLESGWVLFHSSVLVWVKPSTHKLWTTHFYFFVLAGRLYGREAGFFACRFCRYLSYATGHDTLPGCCEREAHEDIMLANEGHVPPFGTSVLGMRIFPCGNFMQTTKA